MNGYSKQRGAVSIFIVIFTALLVTIITISFIRVMVQNQQRATTADLSQSAYDSAQAGVEDAKRLLVTYEKLCTKTATPDGRCSSLERLMRTELPCNTLQQSGISGSVDDKEVLVEQSENDAALQQAYTCVKVMIDTDDYIGVANSGASRIVPLKGTGEFNQVVLEWYSQVDLQDASSASGGQTVELPSDLSLPPLKDWTRNRPSLMRAQLIQFGENFRLSEFDKTDNGSNARTLFLMPNIAGHNMDRPADFGSDTRVSQSADVLQPIACEQTFSTSTVDKNFACSVTLRLPNVVGSDSNARTAYLRLDPVYNSLTHFSVKLQKDSVPVKFREVQPIVDSTGRANDLFRRVQSRVELENDLFPYPESAVDVTGSLCKTFLVTDRAADFNAGLCDPNS